MKPRKSKARLVPLVGPDDALHDRLARGPGGDALLTLELVEALAGLVREGLPFDGACRVAGLRVDSLNRWIGEGGHDLTAGRGETLPARLAWALNRALGDHERRLVRCVMRGADADPALAVEVLALRRPEHWAPAVAEREDVRAAYGRLSLPELKAELRRLLGPGGLTDEPSPNGKPPDVDGTP